MGLHFLGLTPIAWLMREKRLEVCKPVGLWGAYLMGLAFALGWTPCIGPILAAILAIAASEQTVAKGAGMLAVYSLGLGVPFIIAAFAIESVRGFSGPVQKAPASGRAGHGRAFGGNGCCVSFPLAELDQLVQQLAARCVPGLEQDRDKKKPAGRAGFAT